MILQGEGCVEVTVSEETFDSVNDGVVWAGHNQADAEVLCKGYKARVVVGLDRVDVGDILQLASASIAGDDVDVGDQGALGQLPGEAMLAGPLSDKEHSEFVFLHGGKGCRSGGG